MQTASRPMTLHFHCRECGSDLFYLACGTPDIRCRGCGYRLGKCQCPRDALIKDRGPQKDRERTIKDEVGRRRQHAALHPRYDLIERSDGLQVLVDDDGLFGRLDRRLLDGAIQIRAGVLLARDRLPFRRAVRFPLIGDRVHGCSLAAPCNSPVTVTRSGRSAAPGTLAAAPAPLTRRSVSAESEATGQRPLASLPAY